MSEPSTTNLLRAEARLRGQNPAQKTAACGRRTHRLHILLRMAGPRNDFYRRNIRFRRIVNTTDSTIDVPSGMYTRVLPCRRSSLLAVEGSPPCRPGRTPAPARPARRRPRGGTSPCPTGPRLHCIRPTQEDETASEEPGRRLGRLPEMGVRRRRGHSPPRGPLQEAKLHKVLLIHVFHG